VRLGVVAIASSMSIAHRISTLGVLGAGQMGSGIALVAALRAKVPVLLYDRSQDQITKGLSLMDKLLAKDVAKGRITSEEAKDARGRVGVVGDNGVKGLRDVDMVIEVREPVAFKWYSGIDIMRCRQCRSHSPSNNPSSHLLLRSSAQMPSSHPTLAPSVSQRLQLPPSRAVRAQLARRGRTVRAGS
jgi:hypothetical protein